MRRTAVLAVVLAAAGAFGVGLVLHPLPPRSVGPSELQQVRSELTSRYYRHVPASVLSKSSIPGVLAALHDRYTAYLTPAEYRVARRAFAGGYGGIGITVLPAPGGLLVRRTSVGSVHVEGVRPGDTILAVDGASTARLTYHEAVGRILGVPGTFVRLRIRRGQHSLEVRLMRQQFKIKPVHAQLDGKVGIVRVTSFARGSGTAVKAAVLRLRAQGAASLILDLRGNPGGLLDEAVKIASLFLARRLDGGLAGRGSPPAQDRLCAQQPDRCVAARRSRRRRKRECVRGCCGRAEGSRPGDDRRAADVRQVARPADRPAPVGRGAEADGCALSDSGRVRHLARRRSA